MQRPRCVPDDLFDLSKNPLVIEGEEYIKSIWDKNSSLKVSPNQHPSQSLSTVGNERGGILVEGISFKEAFQNLREAFFGKKEPRSPHVSSDGTSGISRELPVDNSKTYAPGDPLPSGRRAGDGPGTKLANPFDQISSRSRDISKGPMGFDPALIERAQTTSQIQGVTKAGYEWFRMNREAGIKLPTGTPEAWANLNAAGTEFMNRLILSPERINRQTTSKDGQGVLEITDGKSSVIISNKGEPVGFSGEIPKAIELAHVLPPARDGPTQDFEKTSFSVSKEKQLAPYWPKNDGFIEPPVRKSLPVGDKIDRWGNEDGRYVSPLGTPFELRGLPPAHKVQKTYFVYEVIKPFEVESGKAMPAFGQFGQGPQYRLPKTLSELIDGGYIRRLKSE